MSKAEDRAFERYPDYRAMDGGYVTQMKKRKVFTEGYHQAEKDLELTWEDVDTIYNLFGKEFNYQLECGKRPQKEACQEVLKRYKSQKGICEPYERQGKHQLF